MHTKYSLDEEKNLILNLSKMADRKVFPNYINKITFPYYKNLDLHSYITFDFPLTLLVGPNGTGKSSVLRALQGSVNGKSPGNYWFSTSVDPIEETEGKGMRNCFFYEYIDSSKNVKEVLKQRAPRNGDPDYWETSRPVLAYGMQPLPSGISRNSAVNKNVIYLDFRSELSAFDKYFNIGLTNDISAKHKKKYIRNQSIKLKNALSGNTITRIRSKKQNELVVELEPAELEVISFILGKNYTSGKLIQHKFFKYWGTSVILDQISFSYSEAMAGSGEIAVVKIVHELLNAPENSLILLDEPEVSIHPGAQAKLKYLILNLIKTKKLQVVVSTHSTTLLENLPSKAIKKFELEPISNKVIIKNECYLHQAFYSLGQKLINSNLIIQTEDDLSKEIITRIIKQIDHNLLNEWSICYNPGGATTMKRRFIPIYSQMENSNTFIIFDGDQKPQKTPIDLETLAIVDLNCRKLDELIFELTSTSVDFAVDGNATSGGRDDQKLKLQKKYYNFYKHNVYYLPNETPEDLIWDSDFIQRLIDDDLMFLQINTLPTSKQKIFETAKYVYGSEGESKGLEKMLLTNWLSKESPEKDSIIETLSNIIRKVNEGYFATTN